MPDESITFDLKSNESCAVKHRKVIFLELNEVPDRILDAFASDCSESALAQVLPDCDRYQTYIEDDVLSPWIAWPTVHRGVSALKHGISNFGENLADANHHFPPIWEMLAHHGVEVGIFGSLHSYPLPDSLQGYAYWIPDAFAQSSDCFPIGLSIFQELNLALSRQSSRNVSSAIPLKLATRFLWQAPRLGVTPATLIALAQQIVIERFKPYRRSRRRTYQSVLSFDLFLQQLREQKPEFTTYFTNHVASAMHRYWAASFPEDYLEFGFSESWVKKYCQEIRFAMNQFSRFFGKLIEFTQKNPEYMVWIVSAMGQSATTADPIKTQLYLTRPQKLMNLLGIPPEAWEAAPAMLPIFSFRVKECWIDVFRHALSGLEINARAVDFEEKEGGFFSLLLGQKNIKESESLNVKLQDHKYSFSDVGLENIVIEDESCASAYHIPEGSLLIYDPTRRPVSVEKAPISVRAIAPTLLEVFGVPVPDYMMSAEQRSPLRQVL